MESESIPQIDPVGDGFGLFLTSKRLQKHFSNGVKGGGIVIP